MIALFIFHPFSVVIVISLPRRRDSFATPNRAHRSLGRFSAQTAAPAAFFSAAGSPFYFAS